MIYVPFLFYCPPVHIQMLKWHIQYWKPNVKIAYSLNSIARHVYAYLSCIMKAKLFIHCLCCVFCIEMLRNSLIPFTFRNRLHFSSAQLIWISIKFIKYFFAFFQIFSFPIHTVQSFERKIDRKTVFLAFSKVTMVNGFSFQF